MRFPRFIGRWLLGGALAGAGITACGGGAHSDRIRGSLEMPEARRSSVALSPALDVSTLYDKSIADRIVVDDIIINLTDVRMLGPDPRIPPDGLSLLSEPEILWAYGGSQVVGDYAFPKYLLGDDDLSVYVRLDHATDLNGASVVVHVRVYQNPVTGSTEPLTVAPDPDGDPAKKMGGPMQSNNQDGDPAHCAPDPDGDPAMPRHCTGSHEQSLRADGPFVRLELRSSDVPDTVSRLNPHASPKVVVGIAASQWFTEEAMARIDAQLAGDPAQEAAPNPDAAPPEGKSGIVAESTKADRAAAAAQSLEQRSGGPGDEYMRSDIANRMKLGR